MHREPDLSERNSNFGLFLVIKQKPLEKKKEKKSILKLRCQRKARKNKKAKLNIKNGVIHIY